MADKELFSSDSRKVAESIASDEVNASIKAINGIKVISPGGTIYYLTVADNGTVITTAVV